MEDEEASLEDNCLQQEDKEIKARRRKSKASKSSAIKKMLCKLRKISVSSGKKVVIHQNT